MAVYKCKMCGGNVTVEEGKTFGTCEYCGSTMTFPKYADEQRTVLFNRANQFRRLGEFDKALAIYENILREDDSDAEAHWCCAISRFGIEYVEDPATMEYLPTCHRASFDNFQNDPDYLAALEHSDGITRRQYQKDAAKIAEVQKGILATSQNEEPFDVFICYKETDDTTGERTRDSVDAQEIYYQLTNEGYRVFFSRITLEDKAGTEYEPYIFAALNSAKVMLVIGSKPEYFSAVWVKNEWARYLSLMRKDRTKLLLPCYKGMDPYDLPEQLSVLQSYDMAKIGFINDLVRGIKKVIEKENDTSKVQEQVVVQQSVGTNYGVLLDRGFIALEDQEWEKADGFFEEVLNQNARCASAYIGKLLISKRIRNLDSLLSYYAGKCGNKTELLQAGEANLDHINEAIRQNQVPGYLLPSDIEKLYSFNFTYESQLPMRLKEKDEILSELKSNRLFSRALQYADGEEKKTLEYCLIKLTELLDSRITEARKQDEESVKDILESYQVFLAKADNKARELNLKARQERDTRYQWCIEQLDKATTYTALVQAKKNLQTNFPQIYGDSDDWIRKFNEKAENIRLAQEQDIERQRQEQLQERTRKEKKKKLVNRIIWIAIALIVVTTLLVIKVIIPFSNYRSAVKLMKSGNYYKAIESFNKMDDYLDSEEKIEACRTAIKDDKYDSAVSLMDQGEYKLAKAKFITLDGYKDSDTRIESCEQAIKDDKYNSAISLMDNHNYESAIEIFKSLDGFKDSNDQIEACEIAIIAIKDNDYASAVALMERGDYEAAIAAFEALDGYQDSEEKLQSTKQKYLQVKLSKATVGDMVIFGSYEQDNKISNGKEDIEWLVLEKENNRILVISEKALDCQQYKTSFSSVTWESSNLRKWMNDTFLNDAFSLAEQALIQNSTVSADKNPNYSTDPGNATTDKVFLLSVAEVEKYISSFKDRKCAPTAYAIAQGAWTSSSYTKDDAAACWWWLRSPGIAQDYAAFVNDDGSYLYNCNLVGSYGCVRPAMWISIES